MSSVTASDNLSVSLQDKNFTLSEVAFQFSIFNAIQFQSQVRITLDGESTSTSNDTTTTTGHITFTLFDRNILILLCMLVVFLAIVSLIGLVLARMMQTPPQMVKYWDNRLLEAFRTNLATQE